MKKSVSLVLAMLLILSCLFGGAALTASAEAEGTGIANLSALEGSNGTFYLTADVGSAENPVTTTVAAFSGTLDGNGYTVYTSVPLFAALNGATVKNLTVEGTVTVTSGDCIGVIANVSTDNVVFANVINNASLTATVTANAYSGAAGFVEKVNGGSVTFTDCVNNGDISARDTAKISLYIGGFIGWVNNTTTSVSFTRCANNGDLYGYVSDAAGTATNTGILGGLTAYMRAKAITVSNSTNTGRLLFEAPVGAGGHKAGGMFGVVDSGTSVTLTDCANTGDITTLSMAAGMIGDTRIPTTFTNCVNTGDIFVKNGTTNVQAVAGGIVGQAYNNTTTTFAKCASYGDVSAYFEGTSNTWVGGICASTNKHFSATDCYVSGTLTSGYNKGVEGHTSDIRYVAGGIVGKCQLATAWFERCIVTATISGSGYYGTGIAGNIVCANTDASKYITVKDCFSTIYRAIGIYANPTEQKGNVRFINTATGFDQTVLGGIDTADVGSIWNVELFYGNVFKSAGGDISNGTNVTGVDAAKRFSAFNFGSGTWVLREGYPELAVADTLLGAATNAKADASIVYEGVQNTAVSEGTYAARFVSKVEGTEFSAVGVRIRVVTSGSATVLGTEQSSGAVYEQILGADEEGVATAYPEAPVEGIYYSALTLTGIPAAGTYTFVVTPFTVSADGQTTDEGGAIAIVYTDGAYVTQYWFAAPTR